MRTRRWTQIAGTLAANPWFAYFSTRTIYQGRAKGLCFPGFNCYACPLALFSCPIGSLQHSLAMMSPQKNASAAGRAVIQATRQHASYSIAALLYVLGFIGPIGSLQHSLAMMSPQKNASAAGRAVIQATRQHASYSIAALLYVLGFIG